MSAKDELQLENARLREELARAQQVNAIADAQKDANLEVQASTPAQIKAAQKKRVHDYLSRRWALIEAEKDAARKQKLFGGFMSLVRSALRSGTIDAAEAARWPKQL